MKSAENQEIPEFLSTHPNSDNRANDLDTMLPQVINYDYKNKLITFFKFQFLFSFSKKNIKGTKNSSRMQLSRFAQ